MHSLRFRTCRQNKFSKFATLEQPPLWPLSALWKQTRGGPTKMVARIAPLQYLNDFQLHSVGNSMMTMLPFSELWNRIMHAHLGHLQLMQLRDSVEQSTPCVSPTLSTGCTIVSSNFLRYTWIYCIWQTFEFAPPNTEHWEPQQETTLGGNKGDKGRLTGGSTNPGWHQQWHQTECFNKQLLWCAT